MQNIKYHAINIASVTLFSLIAAYTINQFIKFSITPEYKVALERSQNRSVMKEKKDFSYYNEIIESGFFKIADVTSNEDGETVIAAAGSLDDLSLLGTITGPSSIARALIKKKGEATPMIFAIYKINEDINNDVYGYTLTRIDSYRVHLTSGGSKYSLELFDKRRMIRHLMMPAQLLLKGVLSKRHLAGLKLSKRY